jgi:hypothetical protein
MTAASSVTGTPPAIAVRATTVAARTLLIALLALFALDNLLLPAFLGVPVPLMLATAVPVGAALGGLLARAGGLEGRIPLIHLGGAFIVALTVFTLGGEGRIFYANPDWQIRDAVMADLASNPWPFAYDIDGLIAVLRAPLGLYLLPSLAGNELSGFALLLSNSVRLAIMLALAGQLFANVRARLIGLGVFLAFSGMDVLANWAIHWLGGSVAWDHIEQWNAGSQFSSTMTLAFWVPNHAIAGWACALAYLLWLRRQAPAGLFAAMIALTALWSPLAAMGALPFAVHTSVRTIREGTWSRYDIALATAAAMLALPSLWFLRLDPGSVGRALGAIALLPFVLLLIFEVAPLLLPILQFKRMRPDERVMIWLVLMCLLFMPMVRIGSGIDFQMRASIAPLALLAFAFAEWLADLLNERGMDASARRLLTLGLVVLAAGAVTPALEVRRAVVNGPSPEPECSLVGAWTAQSNAIPPYGTYLARAEALPGWLAKAPVTEGRNDPARCWATPWVPLSQI